MFFGTIHKRPLLSMRVTCKNKGTSFQNTICSDIFNSFLTQACLFVTLNTNFIIRDSLTLSDPGFGNISGELYFGFWGIFEFRGNH